MARVLVVVARQFNGHELWTSLGVLTKGGHTFEVVSTSLHLVDEVTGERVKIEKTLDSVPSLGGFDALMFISGNMKDTEAYWSDRRTLSLVDEASKANLPIAAICCSVPTVRAAAKGRVVSFFPLIRSRELLTAAGATLSTISLSVDGRLVTAEHQMMTQMWAEAFDRVLKGEEVSMSLVDSKYTPKGRERKPIPEVEYIKKVIERTGKKGLKDA